FAIDSSTGVITVADSSKLDYETTQQFVLTVRASDGTRSSTGTVTVNLNNLNDNPPVVPSSTVAIDENTANGTTGQTVAATDADGDTLTYSLTAGNSGSAFAIDSSTGVITVADATKLDYESSHQFVLTGRAS